MKTLELFAGSRSFTKVAKELGHETFCSDYKDFEGIDYVTDIMDFNISEVPFIPDVIWASPPCTFFSVASIGKHWNKDHTPKTENALTGVAYVQETLDIIAQFLQLNPNLIWFMENPRGKLRKLDVVKGYDRATVCYCQYGDNNMKPTDIWSNNIASAFNPNGWTPRAMCFNGNTNCHHEPAPRGSRSGIQGVKGNYNRSVVPRELILEVLDSLSINVIGEEYRGHDYGDDE